MIPNISKDDTHDNTRVLFELFQESWYETLRRRQTLTRIIETNDDLKYFMNVSFKIIFIYYSAFVLFIS